MSALSAYLCIIPKPSIHSKFGHLQFAHSYCGRFMRIYTWSAYLITKGAHVCFVTIILFSFFISTWSHPAKHNPRLTLSLFMHSGQVCVDSVATMMIFIIFWMIFCFSKTSWADDLFFQWWFLILQFMIHVHEYMCTFI